MAEKIFNPKSGNYVSLSWALRMNLVSEDGAYLDEDGNVVTLVDVVDRNDVSESDEELKAIETETKLRVRAHFNSGDADLPTGTDELTEDEVDELTEDLCECLERTKEECDAQCIRENAATDTGAGEKDPLTELPVSEGGLLVDSEAPEGELTEEAVNVEEIKKLITKMKEETPPPTPRADAVSTLQMPTISPVDEVPGQNVPPRRRVTTTFSKGGGMRVIYGKDKK